MTGWRGWALAAGAIVSVCGALLWSTGGGLMLLIFGVLMMVTAVLEPIYGRAGAQPLDRRWQTTDERFVDPETGKLVTAWFDPQSGERRYVEENGAEPPRST
jgi:hypothetical protein